MKSDRDNLELRKGSMLVSSTLLSGAQRLTYKVRSSEEECPAISSKTKVEAANRIAVRAQLERAVEEWDPHCLPGVPLMEAMLFLHNQTLQTYIRSAHSLIVKFRSGIKARLGDMYEMSDSAFFALTEEGKQMLSMSNARQQLVHFVDEQVQCIKGRMAHLKNRKHCPRCRSNNTDQPSEKQERGMDEGMTYYYRCLDCQHTWNTRGSS